MRTLPFSFVAIAAHSALALADDEALAPTQEVELSARLGRFLPLTGAPSDPASAVRLWGKSDAAMAQSSATLDVQAPITSWFELAAMATYQDGEAYSGGGVQLGLLQDQDHGVDLQIGGGYSERGVSGVSAILASVAVGHEIGDNYLAGAGRIEIGTEEGERSLVLNTAAIHTVSRSLYAGIDSAVTLDLERDADEPMAESTWAIQVGPVMTLAARRVAATASAGLSINEPRLGARQLGMFGIIGIATAL
jgi:hypothetical protein